MGASAGPSQAARHTPTEEWQSHLAHTHGASNTAVALAAGPPPGAGLARARWVPRLRGPGCKDWLGLVQQGDQNPDESQHFTWCSTCAQPASAGMGAIQWGVFRGLTRGDAPFCCVGGLGTSTAISSSSPKVAWSTRTPLPSTPPASVASWTIGAFKSAPHRIFNRPTWHLNTRVPVSNWLLKTAASLQNASITVTVGSDGRQVGARLGREEMGAPGTAVTVCHYGQLSAPAASCHCARHETYPLSDPPAGLSGGCIIN